MIFRTQKAMLIPVRKLKSSKAQMLSRTDAHICAKLSLKDYLKPTNGLKEDIIFYRAVLLLIVGHV